MDEAWSSPLEWPEPRYSLAWTEGAWWTGIHETIARFEYRSRNERRLRTGNIMRRKLARLRRG
jgi:hypothetical protein